jgi:uncharacterized protein
MPAVHQPAPTTSAVDQLSAEECWQYLATATVGRVGFVSPHGVQILPVNYRPAETVLLFKTRPGSMIAELADTTQAVAFEVDYHGRDFDLAWSVLMHGTLQPLDQDGQQQLQRLRRPIQPWPGDDCSLVLQFVPDRMSGRALQRQTA